MQPDELILQIDYAMCDLARGVVWGMVHTSSGSYRIPVTVELDANRFLYTFSTNAVFRVECDVVEHVLSSRLSHTNAAVLDKLGLAGASPVRGAWRVASTYYQPRFSDILETIGAVVLSLKMHSAWKPIWIAAIPSSAMASSVGYDLTHRFQISLSSVRLPRFMVRHASDDLLVLAGKPLDAKLLWMIGKGGKGRGLRL